MNEEHRALLYRSRSVLNTCFADTPDDLCTPSRQRVIKELIGDITNSFRVADMVQQMSTETENSVTIIRTVRFGDKEVNTTVHCHPSEAERFMRMLMNTERPEPTTDAAPCRCVRGAS